MRVLLADDSQLILDRLQEMIHDCKGAEVVGSYKNGTDALAAIRNGNPDLAIIDINMPGLNGLQVLEEGKKENHTTRFMILTLYASINYRKKALALGVDYFFSKVDDFEKVMPVILDMLKNENSKSLQ